jgi:hypothetical protein
VDNILKHYASEYYDPVKAHEYYLQNRELKGRQKMSGTQQDVWDQVKDNISSSKNARIKSEQKIRDQKIQELTRQAEQIRTRITNKIRLLNKKLSKRKIQDLEEEKSKIRDELKTLIQNIRDEYEASKMNIDSEYKQISRKEKANIMNNLPGADSEKKGKVWRADGVDIRRK